MAKLKAPQTAGWNAGKNFYAKMMRIEDIIIDPDIARVFKMSDTIREEIKQDIKRHGFDKGQPLGLWKGKNVVLDGHTRLAAAKEAGLEEVPVIELEFEDKEDAILYTFERQVIRRNLTPAEILRAVELMPNTRARKGEGRSAEQLARRLGVSAAHIYQTRAILEKAPEADVEAIKNGRKSVKEVYLSVNPPKQPRQEKDTDEILKAIPTARLDILKSAVILLTEAKETKAARLLMEHFFRKDERAVFMETLPEKIGQMLSQVQSVPV
jgi:ParB family chromosome partitioning protein